MNYSTGGNLIDDNWIGREYEWDPFNRMTMVKNGSGTPIYGFEYGATGEREVQNTYAGGLVSSTRIFLYDREDVEVEFSDDQFSRLFRQYIHGPGIDEPLAILGDDVGEYTYYLHDGLGSVTGMVNEIGVLRGSIEYSAFGETRQNSVSIENRYRYTSREFVERNLYYYRARHMRPDLGRFISMDPLKTIDGTNMFGYGNNNPIVFLDPEGYGHYAITYCDGDKLKWKFTSLPPEELKKCLAAHEEDHIKMLPQMFGGNPCCPIGKNRMSAGFTQYPEKYDELECRGLLVELNCVEKQFPNTTITTKRMDDIRGYRNSNNHNCRRFE